MSLFWMSLSSYKPIPDIFNLFLTEEGESRDLKRTTIATGKISLCICLRLQIDLLCFKRFYARCEREEGQRSHWLRLSLSAQKLQIAQKGLFNELLARSQFPTGQNIKFLVPYESLNCAQPLKRFCCFLKMISSEAEELVFLENCCALLQREL